MRNAATETKEQVESAVRHVSSIVEKMAGIQLGAKQAPMVESRLRSRMARLSLHSLQDYLEYLDENSESESQALLSLLTTHHTFFFREFAHFELLLNQGLPKLIERARARGDRKIRIWSAAASRGQEVYSLAMFMRFHLAASAPDVDFEICGTDIDPESIKWAKNGVYKADELKQAPAMYVEGNWIRGQREVKDYSKVRDHLRAKCSFQTANLLACADFLKGKKFDIIFCRNVFIYFDPGQIKQCSRSFLDHLDPEGWLFLGVSESLNGSGLPVQSLGLSVYRHPSVPQKGAVAVATPPPAPAREVVRKVLCVDDSPTILAILKKILGPQSGFEVVATANNGLQAIEILKTKSVDVITLDLHMPEMDGLGFLANYKDRKAPIVIMSAINRDDVSIAQKALALGAADYIEKPSLDNVAQASNEIRSKLKTVLSLAKAKLSKVS